MTQVGSWPLPHWKKLQCCSMFLFFSLPAGDQKLPEEIVRREDCGGQGFMGGEGPQKENKHDK